MAEEGCSEHDSFLRNSYDEVALIVVEWGISEVALGPPDPDAANRPALAERVFERSVVNVGLPRRLFIGFRKEFPVKNCEVVSVFVHDRSSVEFFVGFGKLVDEMPCHRIWLDISVIILLRDGLL